MSSSSNQNDEELRYQALLALPLGEVTGISQLLTALRDGSWRVRKAAVERLTTELPAVRAVPKLIAALSDQDDASLRNSALEALVRYGDGAVEALCTALESQAADVRKFSLDALGEIRSRAALPSLRTALADGDPNVRTAAVEALGKLGGPEVLDDLIKIAASGSEDLRLAALDALGRNGAEVPFEALEVHLNDRYLRRVAVRALGRATGEAAEQAALTAAVDPTRGTREAAFAALASLHRNPQSTCAVTVATLGPLQRGALSTAALEMLGGEDLLAGEGAAFLLGWMGFHEAAVSLARAAEHEELREALKQALILLGSAALPPLTGEFTELPAAARSLVLEALAEMARARSSTAVFREEAQTLAMAWLGRDEDAVCLAAIDLLGAVGDEGGARALLELLADAAVGPAAVSALEEIAARSPEKTRDLYRKALRDSAAAPAELFRLLGQVGTPEDLPALRAALRGGAPASRQAAAAGLSTLRLAECLDLLRTALTDEDAGVRAHAARGLASLRSAEGSAALAAALRDPDEAVAAAAAEGLANGCWLGAAKELTDALDRELPRRPLVALAALGSLESLGNVELVVLERAARSEEAELAKAALGIAARQRQWSVVHELTQHPRWDVRSEAAAALGKEGGAEAETLLRRMQEQEVDVLARKAVASALAAVVASRSA